MKLKNYKLNEGFSFYDDKQWMPNGETAFENSFRDFYRKHDMNIMDKDLYKLCENLYDIIRYHCGIKQDERIRGVQISEKHSNAIYGIKTFIYNRLTSSEHYSEVPTQEELDRLKSDLFILGRGSVGRYNFANIAQHCEMLLDDYSSKISSSLSSKFMSGDKMKMLRIAAGMVGGTLNTKESTENKLVVDITDRFIGPLVDELRKFGYEPRITPEIENIRGRYNGVEYTIVFDKINTMNEDSKYDRLVDTMNRAAEELSTAVMEDIYWDFLSNASDLNVCDDIEISHIIDLANCDRFSYLLDEELVNTFSIKDIIKKYGRQSCPDAVDKWVEENWEDCLDKDTVDALYDFFDVGGILGKRDLNGGSWEAFRDFQIAVSNNVISKIKATLNNKPVTEAWDPKDEYAGEIIQEYKEAIDNLESIVYDYKYLLKKKVINLDDMGEMIEIVNEASDNLYKKVTHKYYTVKDNVQSLYNH